LLQSTSVTFAAGVTAIGENAFDYCTGLTIVTIPANVKTIGRGAFGGCGLESVTITEGVTTIGDSAFIMCMNLVSITIPASVKAIEDDAFAICPIIDVIFAGTIPSSSFSTGSSYGPFFGDLRDKFYATDSVNGTPGRYTRSNGSALWTRVS